MRKADGDAPLTFAGAASLFLFERATPAWGVQKEHEPSKHPGAG
jgi:hypothetical protein